jgi:hypothetical protein
MSKGPVWVVRRTREEFPCERYMVVRRGDGWLYQYADTRAEADALAREANESIGDGKVPCSTDAIVRDERRVGA